MQTHCCVGKSKTLTVASFTPQKFVYILFVEILTIPIYSKDVFVKLVKSGEVFQVSA